jgi:hypothetical protein
MGGPFDGGSMNSARGFGPDLANANLSTWWAYLVRPVAGAVIAVRFARVLRGPAKAQEAFAAEGRQSTGARQHAIEVLTATLTTTPANFGERWRTSATS